MPIQDKQNDYLNLLNDLKIDCTNCSGLCCVALYCSKVDGFPENKEAGIPCQHLQSNFQCDMHQDLSRKNMKGCMTYECFGAGQKVTQMYGLDHTWQTHPQQRQHIFETFLVVFQLHQMLWYLIQASTLDACAKFKQEIAGLIEEATTLTTKKPYTLLSYDIDHYRNQVNKILKCIIEQISKPSNNHSKMYLGKNFKGKNLDHQDFSMSLLIAANLKNCSLRGTNFLSADLRDANFKNTDLRESLFLTQMQINSAKGNHNTLLPSYLTQPCTWL